MTLGEITAFLPPNSSSHGAAHPSSPAPHTLQCLAPLPQPQYIIQEHRAPLLYCRLQTQLSASCDYCWDLNQPHLPLPQACRPKLSQEMHPTEKINLGKQAGCAWPNAEPQGLHCSGFRGLCATGKGGQQTLTSLGPELPLRMGLTPVDPCSGRAAGAATIPHGRAQERKGSGRKGGGCLSTA